ncbi:single-stranded DNA-binding protein [Microbacterium resistens]|uniref:single-stranded DNA-binding protein n=1 Tax=Microbacterium resistens TaxID=156977 RepID=UPI001C5789F3|nr:single-stranded DNA-binding protein [Microbacterium resistens]MBW1640185.1 single-stranded DNA-binding protein [Microbacterium resistens]
MALRTQESFSGFIASDPQLSYTARGEARFYARVGQEHYRKEPDGTFTELDPTFHDLVAYRATAERAHERFAKGDSFVAEGYTHPYEYERDGETVQGEEFVAKKVGHDLARTSYEVTRARSQRPVEQDAPMQSAQLDAPEQPESRHASTAPAAPALGL